MNNKNFLQIYDEIKYDMSKASLEDVTSILNNYNKGMVEIDGANYHFDINPISAASLNERYKELTGEDHPTFIAEQGKVLDRYIKTEPTVRVNGMPSIYQRLKNNLTGEGLGIKVLTNYKDSYINKFDEIKYDMSKATLEDVKNILDNYGQDSAVIDGTQHHCSITPLEGASLNERYKELTGKDHDLYTELKEKVIDKYLNDNIIVKEAEKPSIYEQLKNGSAEIGNRNHILNRMTDIMQNLDKASLEEVSSLLNYYNGDPVIIDGTANHPYNEPMTANKLNERYKELTGEYHPNYLEQTPKVVDELIKAKDILLGSKAYTEEYFDKAEKLKSEVLAIKEQKNDEIKKTFVDERQKQRETDLNIRANQINGMQQANENIEENSMEGMSR